MEGYQLLRKKPRHSQSGSLRKVKEEGATNHPTNQPHYNIMVEGNFRSRTFRFFYKNTNKKSKQDREKKFYTRNDHDN